MSLNLAASQSFCHTNASRIHAPCQGCFRKTKLGLPPSGPVLRIPRASKSSCVAVDEVLFALAPTSKQVWLVCFAHICVTLGFYGTQRKSQSQAWNGNVPIFAVLARVVIAVMPAALGGLRLMKGRTGVSHRS